MQVLITGADGFTGKHLCAAVLRLGGHPVALRAHLQNPGALAQEIASIRPEFVIHLAAISFVGHADLQGLYEVNTVGTTHLLDALSTLDSPPRHVILASSANVYGNNPLSPIGEDAPLAPVNHYAASKAAMEMMACNYAVRLPITIVRPFNYSGPGQSPLFVIPKLVQHFAQRAADIRMGNMHVLREYNPVRFVCEAYLHLMLREQPGRVWNICSGVAWSLQQVIGLLEEMTSYQMAVKQDSALVRANELHRLCGDPRALRESFRRHRAKWPLNEPDPESDLRAMLADMLAAITPSSSA